MKLSNSLRQNAQVQVQAANELDRLETENKRLNKRLKIMNDMDTKGSAFGLEVLQMHEALRLVDDCIPRIMEDEMDRIISPEAIVAIREILNKS